MNTEPPKPIKDPESKPLFLKSWLVLAAVEGVLAFILLFIQPSEERRSALFGYSLTRLLLGLAVLAAVAALTWLTYRAQRDRSWLQATCRKLDHLFIEQDWLVGVTFALILATVFLAGLFLLFSTRFSFDLQDLLLHYPAWMAKAIDLLRAGFYRTASLIAWGLAVCLQTFSLLIWSYAGVYRQKGNDGSIFRATLVIVMAGLSLFHWTVLLFHLKTFMVIPGWKWYITPKELRPNQYGLFVVLFLLALILIQFVLKQPIKHRRNTVILIILGYALQVGFGFIAGDGFEVIRLKYADSIFNGYAWAAAEQPPLYQALTGYETIYGADRYLGTKPPGILIPYVATEKVAGLLSPSVTVEQRFYMLTRLAAYVYPLVSFLVLGVLVAFSRRLLKDPQDAILPAIIYVLCPNVILIPMFLDQVLYPLLFMLVLLAALRTLDMPGFAGGLLVGAASYVALYFSFSLLALLPFVILWAGLEWLRRHTPGSLKRTLLLVLGVLAGAVAMLVLFRLVLNYDIFTRYLNAFANHRTTWYFNTWQERILHGIVLNNAEFITWTGFPVILLLLVRLGRAVLAYLRRKAGRLDSLAITFFAAYTLLVVFGQTNGEVQRLYLFLTPLVALLSADELKDLFKRKKTGFILVAVLQLITTVLIFHFQDFYG